MYKTQTDQICTEIIIILYVLHRNDSEQLIINIVNTRDMLKFMFHKIQLKMSPSK